MLAEWSWYTVTLVIQLHTVNLPASLRTTTDAIKSNVQLEMKATILWKMKKKAHS